MTHPIPSEALDDRLGFIGTSGSGKTYAAGTCVERLLDLAARVVIVDPLDVWWGLRLIADGSSPSRYPIVIFGGEHADLPLTEHAGAIIGETVATMSESCIVSLGSLTTKAAERRFMLAFLDAIYRNADPRRCDPFHVVFDEADLWAPQKSSEPMLQSRMEEIVRRGRVKGFIPWLITQRPAVISKDVLSQVDGLIAFKLTSSQDRDAIEGWIEGQADRAQWKDIRAQLPTMEIGQGVVWLPGRGVLTPGAKFPPKRTFDSSRTPKRGEKRKATALKPLDLGALKDRLATVEAETKANDPKALKAEVAALRAKLTTVQMTSRETTVDTQALTAAEQRGYERARIDLLNRAKEISLASLEQAKAAVDTLAAQMGDQLEAKRRMAPQLLVAQSPSPREHWRDIAERVAPLSPRSTKSPAAAGGSDLPRGERACLIVIAQHPTGVRREQLTVRTGYKRSSRDAYIQRLRERGYVALNSDRIIATNDGIAALGADFVSRPSGRELQEFVLRDLPEGERQILTILIRHYPHEVAREAIDDATGYKRSSRDAYLQRLSARELVETAGRGSVRASSELFD